MYDCYMIKSLQSPHPKEILGNSDLSQNISYQNKTENSNMLQKLLQVCRSDVPCLEKLVILIVKQCMQSKTQSMKEEDSFSSVNTSGHSLAKSQNTPSWKGLRRIIDSNSQLHSEPPQLQILYLRALSKHSLNSDNLGTIIIALGSPYTSLSVSVS